MGLSSMSDLKQSRTLSPQKPANLPSTQNVSRNDAFERAKADMEAVFLEDTEFERQGKLDEPATKRIEAQIASNLGSP